MDQYDRWRELLASSFDQFMSTLGAYLPSLFGAMVLLIAGILAASLCRWLILRLGQGMDQVAQRLSFGTQYLKLRWPVSRITATIVYWLIILFFITAVAESLGLPGLAEWLGQLIIYLPSILIALLIAWFGVNLGNVAREKLVAFARSNNLLHAEELAAATRIVIIVLAIILGLDQVGVQIKLLEQVFIVIAAAVLFALALSFGLGAGPAMMNIIAISSLKLRYQPGNVISIDDIEGEIQEFTRTAIILRTESGLMTVPAKLFQEKASLQLNPEDQGDG